MNDAELREHLLTCPVCCGRIDHGNCDCDEATSETVRTVQLDLIDKLGLDPYGVKGQTGTGLDLGFLDTPLTEYDLSQDKRRFNSILDYRENGELDLSPSYQRESVWEDARRQKLWKTMLQGASVGVIYLNKRANFYEDPRYYVVDGKQRIEAYLAFLDGELELPRIWFADRLVNAGQDSVQLVEAGDSRMVRFADLTIIGQRHARQHPTILLCETDLPGETDEAKLFLTVNEGGVAQREDVMAQARAMAAE